MEEKRFEVAADELIAEVEAGAPWHVLDVRAEHRLAGGTVDIVGPERFLNVKGSEVMAGADPAQLGIDPDSPWIVVCGLGKDSLKVAQYLNSKGVNARSLAGGIAEWMDVLVPRELDPGGELDHLIEFDRIGKGSLSYLLGSGDEALLVDPPRQFRAMLRYAAGRGLRISAVADTHAHADYISGGPQLAAQLEIPYCLHPADAIYPYDGSRGALEFFPVEQGSEIKFGKARVSVEHTPGHTEGSVTLRCGDALAFSGDFIFIDSVGRPDLGGQAEAWSSVLFSSLEQARRSWPGEMRVQPAHYASDAERESDHSIGRAFELLEGSNEPLGIVDEAEFTAWILERVAPFPEAYKKIKATNIGLYFPDDKEARELEVGRNQCALG